MSNPGTAQEDGFWYRIAMIRIHMLMRTRPQFHYAVEVLFHSAVQGLALVLVVLALSLFDISVTIDFELLAHFVGPLGAGALAAGHVRLLMSDQSEMRGWVVSAAFGGVTVLTFLVLIGLQGAGLEWAILTAGFFVGAAIFMLLYWLLQLEARKARAA